MSKIEELKIRLRSLEKSPVFAKVAAAEELITCAVDLLAHHEARLNDLEQRVIEGAAQ